MKKNFIYALMSAIALIGTTGFTSCSEEDVVDVNPTYNPETGELNVDFVFSVSTSNTPTTRMSAANTQANLSNTFRGLTNATLWTFKHGTTDGSGSFTPVDGTKIDYDYVTADADITGSTYTGEAVNKTYYLGTVLAGNAISQADATNATSHRIIELALPSGTNNLMFWGKAIKDGTDAQQGKASWSFGENLKDITISTDKIITTDNKTAFDEYLALLSECLTHIVRASVTASSTSPITFGSEQKTGTFRWCDYVTITMNNDDVSTTGIDESLTINKIEPKIINPYTATPEKISALGEILAGAYTTLNTVYANELRSGSAPAIKYMMQDLYSVIYPVTTTTPLSLEETIAQEVAKAILLEIEKTFEVTKANDSYTFGDFWSPNTIISKHSFSSTNYPTIGEKTETGTINSFPRSFNLPLGATILTFNKENSSENSYQWVYLSQVPTYAMGTVGGSFDPNNYMYPPELCYFANSTIRVSDKPHVATDYPEGPTNWEYPSSWTSADDGWVSGTDDKGSHVISTTRSVAMKDNIQYGTALLKSTVMLSGDELHDNNKTIQSSRFNVNEEDHIVEPTTSDGFLWTGVLVGGQTQSVGWNYLAKIGSGFDYMVYDCDLPSAGGVAVPLSGESAPNYTLVWDNWDNSCKGNKQRDVYIALEFVNNVQDFWGQNNLIRKGGTFYLIGKLDPNVLSSSHSLSTSDLSEGISWPDTYEIPPYITTEGSTKGQTLKERRVFIQDYMTTANFVIGATSLQHALVAVPDLRSSQISLGLSVDLEWQTGLTYPYVVLGD